ncbi:hypothetical protein PG996_001324 [Apiospora saccharicola]|uniref:Uncharacterized protein n=1 Tax=Apiospora saccharicola TaxID=335842 RepID=A0ABR1WGB0_9PEZI
MFVIFTLPLSMAFNFRAGCKKQKMHGMGLCLFQSFRLLRATSHLNLINRIQDLDTCFKYL